MATNIGIGFSQRIDVARAASDAVNEAKDNILHHRIDLAIIIHTSHYYPGNFLPTVSQSLPGTKIIGSSSAGILIENRVAMRGVAVIAIQSDDILFGTGSASNISAEDTREAGVVLAKETIANFGNARRQAFILLTDGLLKNNSLILKGVQDIIGTGFPIIGAGSSDDFHFKRTYQILDKKFMSNSAVGMLLGGQVAMSLGSKHGWRPLGKPRIADTVDGNIIRTIDGKPASKIYDEYFGPDAQKLRTSHFSKLGILYPLGFFLEDENEYLLRNPENILEDGSIVCQDEIPLGSEVHIMIGNKDSCKQAAIEAAEEVKKNLFGKQPNLIMVFESLARQKLLGRAAMQEIKMVHNILGQTAPIVGMYSYGEIAPFQSLDNIKRTHVQNESIVILAFC